MPAELAAYVNAEGVTEKCDLMPRENMSFAFEPNCCTGKRRINVGGSVVMGKDGPVELNSIPNRVNIVEKESP